MRGETGVETHLSAVIRMYSHEFVSSGADLSFGAFRPTCRQRSFLEVSALLVDAGGQGLSARLIGLKPIEDRVAGSMI